MEKALDQGAAVAALLEPQHRTLTRAWICLVGQPELLPRPTGGVTVVGIDHLGDAVRTLPPVLEPSLVGAIHHYLGVQPGHSSDQPRATPVEAACTDREGTSCTATS